MTPDQMRASARLAVEAVRAKYPDRPADKYPSVLTTASSVASFTRVAMVTLAELKQTYERELLFPAFYLGPLDLSPGRVAVIVWDRGQAEAWTFDPVTGAYEPDLSLAMEATLP